MCRCCGRTQLRGGLPPTGAGVGPESRHGRFTSEVRREHCKRVRSRRESPRIKHLRLTCISLLLWLGLSVWGHNALEHLVARTDAECGSKQTDSQPRSEGGNSRCLIM